MNNNFVKSFSGFVNESYEDPFNSEGNKALVTLEFDWTWADQKDEEHAREAVESMLMELPSSIKVEGDLELSGWDRGYDEPDYSIEGDLELSGWDRDYDEPDYSTPYLVELTLAFRGDTDSFTADLSTWLKSTQLLELYDIDFNK